MPSSHLKILLWKNWLLWKRNMCCSVTEIILPVVMCCFFYVFRGSLDSVEVEEKSYLSPDFKSKPPIMYPYNIWPEYSYPANLPTSLNPTGAAVVDY